MTNLRYLSTKAAAEIVGISETMMREVVNRREIRWINVGTATRTRVRIAEEDLRAWMDSRASSAA